MPAAWSTARAAQLLAALRTTLWGARSELTAIAVGVAVGFGLGLLAGLPLPAALVLAAALAGVATGWAACRRSSRSRHAADGRQAGAGDGRSLRTEALAASVAGRDVPVRNERKRGLGPTMAQLQQPAPKRRRLQGAALAVEPAATALPGPGPVALPPPCPLLPGRPPDGDEPEWLMQWGEVCPASACMDLRQATMADAGASLIDGGASFLRRLLQSATVEQAAELGRIDQRSGEALHNLSQLMWFLHAWAADHGQGFDEGAFVLLDREGLVSAYLMAASARKRPSSHLSWTGVTAFGIDLPPPAGAVGLPVSKRHLLVTVLPPEPADITLAMPARPTRLFVKPENYGLSWSDLAHHAWQYALAQAHKAGLPGCGADEGAAKRKERMPRQARASIDAIVAAVGRQQRADRHRASARACPGPGAMEAPAPGVEAADSLGRARHELSLMVAWCRQYKRSSAAGRSPAVLAEVDRLLQLVAARKWDGLEVRIGNEVIIDLAQLCR